MIEKGQFHHLLRHKVGPEAIAYALGVSEAEAEAAISYGELPRDKQDAWERLRAHVERLWAQSKDGTGSREATFGLLLRISCYNQEGCHILNDVRRVAGIAPPGQGQESPLEWQLLRLAEELFPGLLLPSSPLKKGV